MSAGPRDMERIVTMESIIAAYQGAIGPVFALAILTQPVAVGLLVLAPAAVLSVVLARLSGRLWTAA